MAENTVATKDRELRKAQESTHEPERYVAPAVDIYETDEGLHLVADMPGLDQSDINVSVEQDVLTIKGTNRWKTEGEGMLIQEFEPLGYYRQFTLGSKIDQNAIKASYRHGVLELELPFAAEAKPRQIEVKVA